ALHRPQSAPAAPAWAGPKHLPASCQTGSWRISDRRHSSVVPSVDSPVYCTLIAEALEGAYYSYLLRTGYRLMKRLLPGLFALLCAQAQAEVARAPDRPSGEGAGPYAQLILRGVTVIDGTGAPAYGPAD